MPFLFNFSTSKSSKKGRRRAVKTAQQHTQRRHVQQIEGARATADYRAEEEAERDKTAKLRAARLARDQGDS
jgi:hypothetical protein